MTGNNRCDKNLSRGRAGFTLIEIIVAVSLFTVVMLIMTTIFNNVIEGQRAAIAAQNTQESLRYIMEFASKEMRTAKKLANANECAPTLALVPDAAADTANMVFDTASTSKVLLFKNKNNECVAYYLDQGRLAIIHDSPAYGSIDVDSDYQEFATPNEIAISNLSFQISDDAFAPFHSIQPRVTIRLDVENKTLKAIHKQKMQIETTISSRAYW